MFSRVNGHMHASIMRPRARRSKVVEVFYLSRSGTIRRKLVEGRSVDGSRKATVCE